MTVTIISATFDKKNQLITIEAENSDEMQLQRMERLRDDYIQQTVEFEFFLKDKYDFQYIVKFLKRQKAVKEAKAGTWNECLAAITGTVTQLNGKYINRAA